ncbi:DUF2892 domain-containing protein [Pseudomonas sp. LS44]|uniref:YgaP family membrane protein n=1 Tax=Pseudomonas sp. LS44 TaxID=1357074 RepID=UPI00215AF8A7|nr:YgaP-like transmembrane domain [Pseudomonas sp. LS44]UVE16512.1 DUF2892 domain-containing protein [Pseudomonas sp. LS44]
MIEPVKPSRLNATSLPQSQNVQGWERCASLGGGALLIGKGLRRGGVLGLIEITIGGVTLARGVSGQCPAKRFLAETRAELAQIRDELEIAARRLSELQAKP